MNVFDLNQIWRFALLAVPLALLVAALVRCLPCRPSTRYGMWLTLLLLMLLAPFLPRPPVDEARPLLDAACAHGRRLINAAGFSSSEPQLPLQVHTNQDHFAPDSLPAGEESAASFAGRFSEQPRALPPCAASDRQRHQSGRRNSPVLQVGPHERNADTERGPACSSPPVTPVIPGTHLAAAAAPPGGPHAGSSPDAGASPLEAAPGTSPEPVAAGRDQPSPWAAWAAHLRALRQTILTLPPIPAPIWLGGAAAALAFTLFRIVRFRRLLRTARSAPAEAQVYVREAASEFGLARAPTAQMVDARISPMIWCGLHRRLLLPRTLWAQLDRAGRRAVIFHELAHLKRRDHWVCWLVLFAGILYWWHPVVWWIRRQLREEADLCCDVWVTTLLPSSRRAYATALLETKRFTSLSHPATPAVALGVSQVRAKRFARRLTMVMSQQLTPRITLGGALIVGVLALGSWLATPTLADPSPDGDWEKAEKQAEKAYEHALQQRLAGTTETAAAELARALQALAGDCDDTREGLSLEARIKLLEEHLQKLAALLESRLQGLDKKMPKLIKELDLSQLKELDLSQVKQLEHFSKLQELSELPDMPDMPDLEKIIGRVMASGQGHALPQLMVGGTVAQPGKSIYEETYELPEDRLDALTKLMVRQDVPVLVSPGEGEITVHGTLQQQMIFRAFCDMIKGGEHQVEYELPEGKLDALVELMILDDVPIRIRPGEGCIEVHGNTLEQTIFEAFVDMINAEGAAPGIEVQISGGTLQPPAAPKPPKPPKPAKPGAKAYKAKTHAFKQQLEMLHQQMRAHAAEYEKYMHQVEKLEAKAEQVENEADELEDQADELEGDARIAKIAEANHLMLKAQQLFNEARILEARADVIEAMAEQLEDQADALEDRLEDLYEQMEEEDDD